MHVKDFTIDKKKDTALANFCPHFINAGCWSVAGWGAWSYRSSLAHGKGIPISPGKWFPNNITSTILWLTVFQPWCNPLWLTGLKVPTNQLTNSQSWFLSSCLFVLRWHCSLDETFKIRELASFSSWALLVFLPSFFFFFFWLLSVLRTFVFPFFSVWLRDHFTKNNYVHAYLGENTYVYGK